MRQVLPRCWYGRCPKLFLPIQLLLLIPLSLLFGLLVRIRRTCYRTGLFRVERLPVPVIVVGNLNVGGSGKTPLTIALVQWLRQAGYAPGIISRGYGGKARTIMPVQADSDPAVVGDEPLLMARRTDCPVWIGRKRAEAARQLLAFHPEVNVLVADDGLQHLALARDVELVVVDAVRGFGNGWLLPSGPLREPLTQLAQVDALVINGEPLLAGFPSVTCPSFKMQIAGARFINLADPDWQVTAAHFSGETLHAIAGIGHPERFFSQLAGLGLNPIPLAFADHHAYVESDLPAGGVLMTEKDAVKCQRFARRDLWFLAVDAVVDAGLQPLIINLLNVRKRVANGSKAA